MQTDRQLKARLEELRTMRKQGAITGDEAKQLRESAVAARKAARAESAGPIQRSRTLLAPVKGDVWTPPEQARGLGGPAPLQVLLVRCAMVLRDILRMPRNDDGTVRKRTIKAADKDTPKRVISKKAAKPVAERLPPHTAVVFAIRPDRDDPAFQSSTWGRTPIPELPLRGTKREMFTLTASDTTPVASAFRRARELESTGWICAILHSSVQADNLETLPERQAECTRLNEWRMAKDIAKRLDKKTPGNCPKQGWASKHTLLVSPNGAELNPSERSRMAMFHPDCALPSGKDVRSDLEHIEAKPVCEGGPALMPAMRALREAHQLGEAEIDIEKYLPRPEVVVYFVKLDGWMRMGDREVDTVQHTDIPRADLKDAEGTTIPGSGARSRAETVLLDTTTGPNCAFTGRAVTYTCPATGDTVTIRRDELLNPGGFGDTTADGRKRRPAPTAEPFTVHADDDEQDYTTAFDQSERTMDLADWAALSPEERNRESRSELAPKKEMMATHWTRNTNVSGPWGKAKQSRDSWGTYTRSQDL